jgi:FkbM family methyltransferase
MRPGQVFKNLAKRGLSKLGIHVSRGGRAFGENPMEDIVFHIRSQYPVVFDIGANTGQSIQRFRQFLPESTIHSFEPSPTVFRELDAATRGMNRLRLWNCAIGSVSGELVLNENSNSDLSSILPLGPRGWGTIVNRTVVASRTIDEVLASEDIERIDVLKVDTQGFELEVLKGAKQSFESNRIGMVFFEINFESLYLNLPSLPELFQFLTSHGFKLVSIYDIHYENGVAGWGDALFISEAYLRKNGA